MQEGKRRKFKEVLEKTYFPAPPPRPPPPPPPALPQVDLFSLADDDCLDLEERRSEEEASSGEMGTTKKLTRAQRKRLRKRKLKEAAAPSASPTRSGRRRKFIGPELPPSHLIPSTDHSPGPRPSE